MNIWKKFTALCIFLVRPNPYFLFTLSLTSLLALPFDYLSFYFLNSFSKVLNHTTKSSSFLDGYLLSLHPSHILFLILLTFFFSSLLKVVSSYLIQRYSAIADHFYVQRTLKSYLESGLSYVTSTNSSQHLSAIRYLSDLKSGLFVPALSLISSSLNALLVLFLLFFFTGLSIVAPILILISYYLLYSIFVTPYLSRTSSQLATLLKSTFYIPDAIRANYKNLIIEGTLQHLFRDFQTSYSNLKTVDSNRSFLISINRPLLEFFAVAAITSFSFYSLANDSAASLSSSLAILLLAFFKLLPLSSTISSSLSYLKSNSYLYTTIHRYQSIPQYLNLSSVSNSSLHHTHPAHSLSHIAIKSLHYSHPTSSASLIDLESLNLLSSSTYIVSGSSGTGKTTFLDLLSGLLQPSSGSVSIQHSISSPTHPTEPLHIPSYSQSYRSYFSYLQQSPLLLGDNIYDFLVAPHLAIRTYQPEYSIPSTDVIDTLLEQLSLNNLLYSSDKNSKYPQILNYGQNFSGGQRQRLALAKLLLMPTPFLLLDEPTSSLDHSLTSALLPLIQIYCRSRTVIMVTHDPLVYSFYGLQPTKHFSVQLALAHKCNT